VLLLIRGGIGGYFLMGCLGKNLNKPQKIINLKKIHKPQKIRNEPQKIIINLKKL
jgi:hypothetical protein